MNDFNLDLPACMGNTRRIRITKLTELDPVHPIIKNRLTTILKNVKYVEFSFKSVEDKDQNIKNMNHTLFNIISYESLSKFNAHSSHNKAIAIIKKNVEKSKVTELLDFPEDTPPSFAGGRIYGKPVLRALTREELAEFRSIWSELNDIEYQVFNTTRDELDLLMTLQHILRNRNSLNDWPSL